VKKRVFYWIGLACGCLTLSVGVGIFILWWGARAFFAVDLSRIEGYGLLWMIISIPIALIGIITSALATHSNVNDHWLKDALPFLVLLANIPALWIILTLQSSIADRTYFKLRNRSNQIIDTITLESKSFSKELGRLAPGASLVDYYVPKYLNGQTSDSMPKVEEVTVTFQTKSGRVVRTMPYAMMGWCDRIVVTDSLTLKQ